MKQLASAVTALTFALTVTPAALADDDAAPPAAPPAVAVDTAAPTAAPTAASTSADAPVKRYPPSSVRVKLVIGGLAVAGLAYAAAVGTASNWPEVPGSSALQAPFVGPWIALGQSGCAADDPNCGAKVYLRGILYVIDGIAQVAGLGLVAEGIFMKTEATEPPKKKSLALGLPGGIIMRPVPTVSAGYTGLGLVGSF